MEKVILGGRKGRMKLYLVRHGETDWNKVKKIQGQVDIPLNQFGKHLAEETAEGLRDIPFDLCISSPLSRAHETAIFTGFLMIRQDLNLEKAESHLLM